VSVEGISLTIAELKDDYFEIAVIPKTWEVTNFSHLQAGDEVNLEADVIAKYVERIMSFSRSIQNSSSDLREVDPASRTNE
jgi:riboflavin synthase